MASRNSTTNNANKGRTETTPHARMITNAVHYARAGLQARIAMRQLIAELDRQAALDEADATPPPDFRAALRLPIGSRRKTITVIVDGKRIPLLLNPQGKRDPEREQWLWDFVRERVRRGTK